MPDRDLGARHGRVGRARQGRRVPLAVYLGGSLAPVPAYNSNGLG